MQPYFTENTHNLALDRIITIAVFGDTIGKRHVKLYTRNVDHHMIPYLKVNGLWHSKTYNIYYFDDWS